MDAIKHEAGTTLVMMKSQSGCLEWHTDMAAGTRPGVLESMESFCSDKVLLDSGLQRWGSTRPDECRDEVREDRHKIVESLREFTRIHVNW